MRISKWEDLSEHEISSIKVAFYVCFGTLDDPSQTDILKSWYNIKYYVDRSSNLMHRSMFTITGILPDKTECTLLMYDSFNNLNIMDNKDLQSIKELEIKAAQVLGIFKTQGIGGPAPY